MRRYRKKDIQQALETLTEANHIIAKAAEHNPQKALEALVQCQEVAILTGNYLETQKERYASLTVMLEEYCEEIYQMSKNISDASQLRNLSARVAELLKRIQKAAARDLKDKKEVIFLPYKASMWDSLESVWKAADGDEETDAYVIPIPYYDKNPDGSFREMHYEGDQYPDYVPVTHYSEYDIEERRPDAIYIHNPYDNSNYVTSVEPFYYSENLRRFTEKLVYIPYFVLGEIDPGDQAAVDNVKHFCFVPGVVYAHRVIVQSECIRRIYINEYIKEAKHLGLSGEHIDRAFLEKKILGLGSPKVDKVLSTKKEELKIPNEWMKIIKKPDESWKKIVFYNTSISALLQYNEQMIQKMEWVFAFFYAIRDEVALLWRPHPLIENTLISMRPKLWEYYQKVREKYRKEGWGIYDTTADVDRAVTLSDAYYGDDSSVVGLCQKATIPAMIQNVSHIHNGNDEKVCLWTGGGFEVFDEKIWFVPYWVNILCCYNPVTKRIEKTVFFPGLTTAWAGFSNMKRMGDILVIIPAFEESIYLYHITEDEMSVVALEMGPYVCEKFQECVIWEEYLYIFPYDYHEIMKLDVKSGESQTIRISMSKYKFCDSCTIENTVYLVNRTGCLFAFDLSDEKLTEYSTVGEKCFRTVCVKDQRTLVITDENSDIYQFDLTLYTFEKRQQKYIPANQSIVIHNQLYLFPLRDNYAILKIDMCSWTESRIIMSDLKYYKPWSSVAVSKIKQAGDKIYMMNPNHQCIYILDVETGKLDSCHCIAAQWSARQCDYFYHLSKRRGVYREGEETFASLKYYVSKMQTLTKCCDKEKKEEETMGAAIYLTVKQELAGQGEVYAQY